MDNMPSKIKKTLFSATEDLLKRIDDFRFQNRINSRSEAMRRLLDEALRKYEKKVKK
jgi:metal-responsive CopG/Arc/MetJ family transcriptional regulator